MRNHTTGRSKVRVLAWIAGGLVALLLLAVAAAAIFVDSGAVVASIRERMLPQLSERLGREVRVGEIDLDLFPAPSARIREVAVEGIDERPVLAAEEAVARLRIWPLIRSFGKEIALDSLELRGGQINVARLPDGSWSYEPIIDRVKAGSAKQKAESGRTWSIDRLAIADSSVRIEDRGAPGGTAVATLANVSVDAEGVEPGEPLHLDVKAALQGDEQNVVADILLDPLPVEEGQRPVVSGKVQVRDAPLGQLRNLLPGGLDTVVTGGAVRMTAQLSTEAGRYVASGDGGVDGLRMRGEPARMSFRFDGSMDPDEEGSLRLALRDIALEGPGIDAGGKANLVQRPLRVDFDLAGRRLDLRTLMGAMPEKPEEEAQGQPIPPHMRRAIADARVQGTLRFDEVVNGALRATDFTAKATLKDGVLTLTEANADVYGGRLEAKGSRVDLNEPLPSWKLKAALAALPLEGAMQALSGDAPVRGMLSGNLDVSGAGIDWEQVMPLIDGSARMLISDAGLTSANLDSMVSGAIGEGLSRLGVRTSPRGGKAPTLQDLRAQVRIDDGWMTLRQPLQLQTSVGRLELGGRIGLDRRLELGGKVHVDASSLGLQRGGSFEVPLEIGGTLQQPRVEGIDAEALARAALGPAQVEKRLGKELESEAERIRREAAKRLLGR